MQTLIAGTAAKRKKAIFWGMPPRFPKGIRTLNMIWRYNAFCKYDLEMIGTKVPGYSDTFCGEDIITDDGKVWLAVWNFNNPSTVIYKFHVLFPEVIFTVGEDRKILTINSSIAFYAPKDVSDYDTETLFLIILREFRKYIS